MKSECNLWSQWTNYRSFGGAYFLKTMTASQEVFINIYIKVINQIWNIFCHTIIYFLLFHDHTRTTRNHIQMSGILDNAWYYSEKAHLNWFFCYWMEWSLPDFKHTPIHQPGMRSGQSPGHRIIRILTSC